MVTIKLGDIIDRPEEIVFTEAISNFSCKDADVEFFLKHKSIEYEKRNKSRTYLILDEDDLSERTLVIVGYFTLSLKVLSFDNSVSKSKIKAIDGFSKDVRAVASILIGQFGKDTVAAQNIKGRDLFDLCLNVIYQIHKLIGGRIVLIECQEISDVVAFYKKSGFVLLQRDEGDKYLQMIRQL